jgi:hypothetical protein
MNTPPSAWALGWVVLGALTAGALAAAQALQRAAALPEPRPYPPPCAGGAPAVDRDWLPWLLAALVMLALLGVLLLVAQRAGPS